MQEQALKSGSWNLCSGALFIDYMALNIKVCLYKILKLKFTRRQYCESFNLFLFLSKSDNIFVFCSYIFEISNRG